MGMPSDGILALGLHLSEGMGNDLMERSRGKGGGRRRRRVRDEEDERNEVLEGGMEEKWERQKGRKKG